MRNPLDIASEKFLDFFEKITSPDGDVVEVSEGDMSPEVKALLDEHIKTKILLAAETRHTDLSPEIIDAREKALSPMFEKLAEMGWEKREGKYYRKRTDADLGEEIAGPETEDFELDKLGSIPMPGYKGPTGDIGSQRPSRMALPTASDLPQTPSYPGIPPHPDSAEYARRAMVFAGSPALAGLLTSIPSIRGALV